MVRPSPLLTGPRNQATIITLNGELTLMAMLKLAAGLAVGYVLGARAGREKYEQISAAARKVSSQPTETRTQEKPPPSITAETSSTPADVAVEATVTTPSPAPRRPARRKATPATPKPVTPADDRPAL
jgi:hypothetical protein